jgi:hypothetical protein
MEYRRLAKNTMPVKILQQLLSCRAVSPQVKLLCNLERAFLRSVCLVDFRRCLPLTSRKHANQYLLRGLRVRLAMVVTEW